MADPQERTPVLVVGGADGAAAHGIAPAGALLVRPDVFVAWRSADAAADPGAELDRALRAVLGRDPPGGTA